MKITKVNKESNTLIPIDKGHIWTMRKSKSKIEGIEFGHGYASREDVNDFNFGAATFSIEAWFETGDDVIENQFIVNKRYGGYGDGFSLKIIDSKIGMSILDIDSEAWLWIEDISPNTIYHIIVIWNRYSNIMSAYLNSIEQSSVSISAYINAVDNDQQFKIGSFSSEDFLDKQFLGNIYLIRTFNMDVTDYVNLLYNNGRPDQAVLPDELLNKRTYNILSDYNSDFEEALEADGTVHYWDAPGNNTYELDTDIVKSGSQSLKCTIEDTAAIVWSGDGLSWYDLGFQDGDLVLLKAWIYVPAGWSSGNIYINDTAIVPDIQYVQQWYQDSSPTDQWYPIASIVTVQGDDGIRFRTNGTLAAGDAVYIDKVEASEMGLYSEYNLRTYQDGDAYIKDLSSNNRHLLISDELIKYETPNLYEDNIIKDKVGELDLHIDHSIGFDFGYTGSLRHVTTSKSYGGSTGLIHIIPASEFDLYEFTLSTLIYLPNFSAYREFFDIFYYPSYQEIIRLGTARADSEEYKAIVSTIRNIDSIDVKHIYVGDSLLNSLSLISMRYKNGVVSVFLNNEKIHERETALELSSVYNNIYNRIAISLSGRMFSDLTHWFENLYNAKSIHPIIAKYAMTDSEIEELSNKLLFLAKHIGVWQNTGDAATTELSSDNFIGIIHQEQGDYEQLPNAVKVYSEDFRYVDSVNNVIYAPLPITLNNDMINSIDIYNDKVYGVTDSSNFELDIEKMLVSVERINTGGVVISSSGAELAIASAGDVIKIDLKEPAEGRVLGYVRLKNDDGTYTHKFFVDYTLVDEITSSDEFINSNNCPLPVDVSGNKMTLSPSDWIIDDLIIDNVAYNNTQFRSLFLSDNIVDNSNQQIVIAPVANFSEAVIYSYVDDDVPSEVKPLVEANKEIKQVTTVEE